VRVEAIARHVGDLDVVERDVGVGNAGAGLGAAVEAVGVAGGVRLVAVEGEAGDRHVMGRGGCAIGERLSRIGTQQAGNAGRAVGKLQGRLPHAGARERRLAADAQGAVRCLAGAGDGERAGGQRHDRSGVPGDGIERRLYE
jgi:hypothetical protein